MRIHMLIFLGVLRKYLYTYMWLNQQNMQECNIY